jgi:hypothetical protein
MIAAQNSHKVHTSGSPNYARCAPPLYGRATLQPYSRKNPDRGGLERLQSLASVLEGLGIALEDLTGVGHYILEAGMMHLPTKSS